MDVKYKVYLYSCQGGTIAEVPDNLELGKTNVAWQLSEVANYMPVMALYEDKVDYYRWYVPWSEKPVMHYNNENAYWALYSYMNSEGTWIKKEDIVGKDWIL